MKVGFYHSRTALKAQESGVGADHYLTPDSNRIGEQTAITFLAAIQIQHERIQLYASGVLLLLLRLLLVMATVNILLRDYRGSLGKCQRTWSCEETFKSGLGLGRGPASQRLQYPLIKEYTLNHIQDPTII